MGARGPKAPGTVVALIMMVGSSARVLSYPLASCRAPGKLQEATQGRVELGEAVLLHIRAELKVVGLEARRGSKQALVLGLKAI